MGKIRGKFANIFIYRTNAINYYAPLIFRSLGIQGTNTNLFATGIYGIVKMVTCAAFLVFAADSLGRRKSLLWTSIAQGIAMFIIGIYVRVSPPVAGAAVSYLIPRYLPC